MKIRPLHDRVLLKRKNDEERSAAAPYIPSSAKEKATQATVVAVGKGRVLEDGSLAAPKVNALVAGQALRGAGTDIKLDGQEHLIMREEDLIAVIDG